MIEAGGYLVLTAAVLPINLRNSGQVVSLYDNLDRLLDTVEYPAAKTGQAFARTDADEFTWTTAPTPDQENKILAPASTVRKSAPAKTGAVKTAATKSPLPILGKTESTSIVKEAKAATQEQTPVVSETKSRSISTYLITILCGLLLLGGCVWLLKTREEIAQKQE